jgi:macrodomain Ter protein organizer (MatP/YcbG family)
MDDNENNKQHRKHRQYYEQPRKKISLDLPYSLYTSIKDRAREMKISMVRLITEALEDILKKTKKYNTVDGLPLSEVFKDDNEEQLDFNIISEEF